MPGFGMDPEQLGMSTGPGLVLGTIKQALSVYYPLLLQSKKEQYENQKTSMANEQELTKLYMDKMLKNPEEIAKMRSETAGNVAQADLYRAQADYYRKGGSRSTKEKDEEGMSFNSPDQARTWLADNGYDENNSEFDLETLPNGGVKLKNIKQKAVDQTERDMKLDEMASKEASGQVKDWVTNMETTATSQNKKFIAPAIRTQKDMFEKFKGEAQTKLSEKYGPKREKAKQWLSGKGYDSGPASVTKFLKQNPNFK